ncbi:MAG TPA: hypothetical protein VJ921_01620, partial [Vicinamibacteria bacterium]|nr:hypothetical protein [Vicinamibacteria bacterium]
MRVGAALAAVLSMAAVASAEPKPRSLCGTFRGRGPLEIAKHRDILERLDRDRRGGLLALAAPRLETSGDLVLMTDDGSLVTEANPFDLREQSIVFSPAGSRGFLYRGFGPALEPGAGDPIEIGDDASRAFDLLFDFPFLGQSYRQLFLNSDGNFTFGAGDSASAARSLERFLSGPPRIALFFADLDPSAGGEVRVLNGPDRFVVTWNAVPEWGEDAPNTFQIEIVRDGTIYMKYGAVVSAGSAIVGVATGGGGGEVSLVDLGGGPREIGGAIAERFLEGRLIDNVGVAKSFYRELSDSYDSLVVWTNFESDEDDAFAYAAAVSNDASGIGDDLYDRTAAWGSGGALESYVFMGDVRRYPREPTGRVLGAAARPTTLGLLAHEVGHRFLTSATVVHPGVAPDVLLGRQGAHWSFFLDTDASFLEGNEITEESPGRFRTVETISRYSRLDLYLMGLAEPTEVAPFFVVTSPNATLFGEPADNESTPIPG